MDPTPITSAQWAQIGLMLTNLWIVVAFVFSASATLLLAHAIIPSLVITAHLPESFSKLRVVFYLLGFVSILAGAFFMWKVIGYSEVISTFYPDYWI
tara:strand:- start:24 stop:314 length:291 start_codon:yes stop_codon:yes gene_type:complete